ncbi:MAG: DUF4831 family protein [Paludibacter sp.]|nr:DUF4831 family protein [Paludibacter sp.]
MKQMFIILLMIITAQTAYNQSSFALTENSPALLYALPKTELCFEVTVEKVVEKPGVFYLYSQRYLATDKVILEEKTNYNVKEIKVTSRAVPDITRRFAVLPGERSALKNISVNEQGILSGVNTSMEKGVVEINKEIINRESDAVGVSGDILPLTQEYMMAGSTAKLAEGAAKLIYDIRESRISLLTGEMDQLPSDGEALGMMLSGLDRKEKELTELFIGSRTSETTVHHLTFIPDSSQLETVLFRLSAKRGFVDKDDMGGEPFYISIRPEKIQVRAADPKAKPVKIGLYTLLPAQTFVKVSNGVSTFLERNFFIPQFGVLMPLSESYFKSPKVKVKVDEQTGRLISIEN